jgi:hypothetical protein
MKFIERCPGIEEYSPLHLSAGWDEICADKGITSALTLTGFTGVSFLL